MNLFATQMSGICIHALSKYGKNLPVDTLEIDPVNPSVFSTCCRPFRLIARLNRRLICP